MKRDHRMNCEMSIKSELVKQCALSNYRSMNVITTGGIRRIGAGRIILVTAISFSACNIKAMDLSCRAIVQYVHKLKLTLVNVRLLYVHCPSMLANQWAYKMDLH